MVQFEASKNKTPTPLGGFPRNPCSLARSVQKPCAPKPLERERGRGGERERRRGEGGREGERRERERGGESAEAGVRPTATPHT